MTIQRIDHINIKAATGLLAKVKAFYMELLDLTEGFRPVLGGDGTWLYTGDHAILHLSEVNEMEPERASNPCLDHYALRCTGLPHYLDKLETMEIEYTRFYLPELDMVQLFFFDPSGIRVELNFTGETKE